MSTVTPALFMDTQENNKASGPDGISPTLLKMAAPEIAPVLNKNFQASYDQGVLPGLVIGSMPL